jgi:hypothetical protein
MYHLLHAELPSHPADVIYIKFINSKKKISSRFPKMDGKIS